VLQQSVKAGSKAAKGSLITLTVNKLQEQPTNTPPPSNTETPPPSGPTTPGITIGG